MDRFFVYLLGGMALVLAVAIGVVSLSRNREVPEAVEPPSPTLTMPTPAPTARPWAGDDALPMEDPGLLPDQEMLAVASPAPTPLPWSPPDAGKTVTVIYPGFTVVYSEKLGNPLAVQYAMVQGAKPKKYSQPAKVTTPTEKALRATGYVPGGMAFASSINLYFGKSSGANTGKMTNLAAFYPGCLAGPWQALAEKELGYASAYKWIEVVAGPIFGNPAMQVGGFVTPVAFYRVYRRSYGDCMALVVPQTATGTDLTPYLTSVAAVEAATGMDIFANTISLEAREQVPTAVW